MNFDRREAVIDESQRLMTARFPQHFCSCDVQRSPRHHELSPLVNVRVGQIHDEERIVFGDDGIEEKGSGIAQFEQEAGKESRPLMVEPFLAHTGC